MAFNRQSGWAAIARFGGIGDNLIASSPLAGLKAKGYKTEVITSDPAWTVFENNPHIDKLSVKSKIEIDGYNMDNWQKWFRGRADEYDVFCHLSHSVEVALAYFPAQTPFYWPPHVRRRLCDRNYLEFAHDIAGVPYEFGPLFHPTAAEAEHARETKDRIGPGPVVGWAISGTRLDKLHPFLPGMVARALKELDVSIVLLGAPGKNFEAAKVVRDHVERTNGSDNRLFVAISTGHPVPEWPIRRTLSFAQVCDVIVTVDTGLSWAVAFEKMPKIVMLSHASPENITKHWLNTVTLHARQDRVPCWPCHQLHNDLSTCTPNRENNGAACMTDISVEQVIVALRSQLEGSQNGKYIGVRQQSDVGLDIARSNPDASSRAGGRAVVGQSFEYLRFGDSGGERLRETVGDVCGGSEPSGELDQRGGSQFRPVLVAGDDFGRSGMGHDAEC
jgi:ADP-heptose:LPS heptosyltransferase